MAPRWQPRYRIPQSSATSTPGKAITRQPSYSRKLAGSRQLRRHRGCRRPARRLPGPAALVCMLPTLRRIAPLLPAACASADAVLLAASVAHPLVAIAAGRGPALSVGCGRVGAPVERGWEGLRVLRARLQYLPVAARGLGILHSSPVLAQSGGAARAGRP